MRFIFFTKTNWNEPPRLRHQLAYLLANSGHEIIFFEKPIFLLDPININLSNNKFIKLYKYRFLIHHKLRLSIFLHHINFLFERRQIIQILNKIELDKNTIIVNFNYEYYFLNQIFKDKKIVTIINDNFWSKAFFNFQKPLLTALIKNLSKSDLVLTVSPSLKIFLDKYHNTKLFLPWSDFPYQNPVKNKSRNILLFWGYIGHRIDFEYLIKLSNYLNIKDSAYEIHMIGKIEISNYFKLNIERKSTIHFFSEQSLSEINFTNVLALIIPYKDNVKEIDEIYIPNKALRILSKGIPIIKTGMPNFIKKPFIFDLNRDLENDYELIKKVDSHFFLLQTDIRLFVNNNLHNNRYDHFMTLINNI